MKAYVCLGEVMAQLEFEIPDDPVTAGQDLLRHYEAGQNDVHLYMMLAKLVGYHARLRSSRAAKEGFLAAFERAEHDVRRKGLAAKIIAYFCPQASLPTRSRYVDLLVAAKTHKLDARGVYQALKKLGGVMPFLARYKAGAQPADDTDDRATPSLLALTKRSAANDASRFDLKDKMAKGSFVLAIGYVPIGKKATVVTYKGISESKVKHLIKSYGLD